MNANLIIDKAGRIIAVSQNARKIFPFLSPHHTIFDGFEENQSKILLKLFELAKKDDNYVEDSIELKPSEENYVKTISVSFHSLKSENNIYFLVNFDESGKSKSMEGNIKFHISTEEIKDLVPNEKYIKLIEKIKLSFPFSFIEKAKIQKEINELDEIFWMKDSEGKYIVVSEKYAEAVGLKTNQIENKIEVGLIPKSLSDIFSALDEYIKTSNNSIIVEGVTSFAFGNSKNVSIIELPLSDLDNNVVAVIGFTSLHKTEKESEIIELSNDSFYKEIPIAFCLIDNENKFVFCSKDFLKIFSLGEKVKLTGESANRLLENELINIIDSFRFDNDVNNKLAIDYSFVEKVKYDSKIKLSKVNINEQNYIQIVIEYKDENSEEKNKKAIIYDALNELNSEPMFIYDIENLKFIDVNEPALKLYGYKKSDFLNMDLTDLYAPEDIQTLIETADSKSISKSYSGPWRHKKSDGSSVFVELRRTQIELNGKNAHLNLIKNVSEQVEVKKKQQLLELVYEHTNEILIVTDKDGFIQEVNENGIKKMGFPKRELEATSFITLLSDENRTDISKNVFHSTLLKNYSAQVQLKKPSGSFQKADLYSFPIKNYNGELDSYIFIIDLMEETPTVDVSHSQEDEIGKIDSSFLSNMFHELLTPLNVILGFAQELGESITKPNDEQKEAIDIIKENQKILLQIMDNAVEYSTLEQKIIKFRTEKIKFVDILSDLKESVKKIAESKKIELQYGKISSSLLLETDKQKYTYLLSLFLKFALQITKEKNLFISAVEYESKYCAVGIKDTLNGITPLLLKAMNEIITTDDTTSRRNYGFSRFSVMLAKKLIHLLSVQKINLQTSDESTEFALLFPLEFTVGEKINAEVEIVDNMQKDSKKKNITTPTIDSIENVHNEKQIVDYDLSSYSCLYLEDQIDSQVLFKVQMKDLKSIEFAISFETALPLLKTKKFDFILMDINLQGEYNGLDALRIIQKMPGYKNVPIIATTAYVQPGAKDRFLSAGFNDYIPKPLLREKIIESLQELFAQK